MKTTLTIAGSDSSGGAGIQADIKTITCNNVYAMSAITALTAQNTTGVYDIIEVPSDFLQKQIEAVVTDIFPDAVKIGMLFSENLITVVYDSIKKFKLRNIVLDPVMIATSGAKLISDNAINSMQEKLFPIVDLITPNIPEAECLSNIEIKNQKDMEDAAKLLNSKFGCAVLIKGGHCINDANDYLYSENKGYWFCNKKINNQNTHGTGCTLSSAIASNLAKGFSIPEAIKFAKEYLCGALSAMLDLGKGSGPLAHNWNIK